MIEGWRKMKMQDICEKITDGTHQTPKYFDDGVIFLSSKNVTSGKIDWENIKYIDEAQHIEMHKRVAPKVGDILLAKNGTTGVAAMVDREVVFDIYVSLAHIRSLGNVIPEYLLYYINSPLAKKQFNKRLKGIGVPNLHLKEIREVEVIFPESLQEQKQIVKILDEAFAAIDKAKANIEKNIENAKELFQSKLNEIFSQKGDGWEETTLGELGKVSMCKRILKKQTAPKGDIPFYKIGTFGKTPDAFIPKELYEEYKNKYSFPKVGDVMISASGTIGRRVVYDGEPAFFQDSNIVWIDNNEEKVLNQYLYQFYGVCDWNPSKGATINRLYNDDLRRIKISYPSIEKQKVLIEQMEKLDEKTSSVRVKYASKLENLAELKKSILQKAFSGELTSSATHQFEIKPLEEIQGINPTDLQAGITAIAMNRHIESGNEHSFHHVKAEKIIHLAEYVLGIDLKRNPVKDAAGPNDFKHSKKVESRARKAGFYQVTKQGDFYNYSSGSRFGAIMDKTKTALNNRVSKLDELLELLSPMKTQQAEIVATVYAAWNNLLLEKESVTDEKIVSEARENWHANKMNIPRNKFFKAIEWMKKHEILIPKGNGKIVKTKKSKPAIINNQSSDN